MQGLPNGFAEGEIDFLDIYRMKNKIYITCALIATVLITACNSSSKEELISFYKVPLVCGADSEIGCGSRIKPLFIETGKEKDIKESWTNKEGTVIAIVWSENENEKLIQSLFEKNAIDGKLIVDSAELKNLSANFRGKEKWLKGMEVDELSIHEAGTIANSTTKFAIEQGIISDEEASAIKADIEEYFKKELVKVRTYEELKSEETDAVWMKSMYDIYVKHIGKERADKAKDLYYTFRDEMKKSKDACCDNKEKDECCKKKTTETLQSEITCPKCGHKKMETMPTDVCLLKYTCEKCKADLFPKDGDCCVFCSYGTHKCPSKQDE